MARGGTIRAMTLPRTAVAALVAAGLVTAALTTTTPGVAAPSPRAADRAPRATSTPARALYVTGDSDHKVAAHQVGPTGALTALGAKNMPAASGPEGVAVSPDGRHVYVATFNDDQVTHFPVNADGSLGTPDAACRDCRRR